MPVPGTPGWSLLLTFIARERGFELAEVRIYPTPPHPRRPGLWAATEAVGSMPSGGIAVRLLRGALTEDLVRAAHAAVVRHVRNTPPSRLPLAYSDKDWPWLKGLSLPTGRTRIERTKEGNLVRPGRARRPDQDYAVWAQRYVKALNEGSRSPVAELADRFGMKATQVRDLLREARRRELLTSLTVDAARDDLGRRRPPGLAGGQLTEKAIALLESTEGSTTARSRRRKR